MFGQIGETLLTSNQLFNTTYHLIGKWGVGKELSPK